MRTPRRRRWPRRSARSRWCSSPTWPACSTAAATSCASCAPTTRTQCSTAKWSPAACARSCRPRCTRSAPGCGASPLAKKEEPALLLHDESPAAVEEREKAFVLGTYARTPFHPRSGKGAKLIDAHGREYWDLLGGIAVNILGHHHPRLVKTLREEAGALLHVSNLYYHPAQGLLAATLRRHARLHPAVFLH